MNKKAVIIGLIVVFALSLGGVFWLREKNDFKKQERVENRREGESDKDNFEQSEVETSKKIILEKCKINSENLILKETDQYDIFGESSFDTIVCGYLMTKKEKVFDEEQENAYFKIIEFSDNKFREVLQSGINSGNSVNFTKDSDLYFNLGCLTGGGISARKYEEDVYLDKETEKRILDSNEKNPVALILSFGFHSRIGCSCCNLAHKIRIVE